MTNLGSKAWVWTVVGRRIGRSTKHCIVRVGRGVVTCGNFAKRSVGWAH